MKKNNLQNQSPSQSNELLSDKELKELNQCTFKPQISKNTEIYAEKAK